MQSVLSLASLDKARQYWIVESDEPCVVEVHAGLPGRMAVQTPENMSRDVGENITRERVTPAWRWIRLRLGRHIRVYDIL